LDGVEPPEYGLVHVISFVISPYFQYCILTRPYPRICKLILIQELEAEGVGMNIEGTNGGEESGLMVRHMCHIRTL
jgi:hypothetical protein